MPNEIKILGFHGLGDQRGKGWEKEWKDAIKESVPTSASKQLKFELPSYDHIIDTVSLSMMDYGRAAFKLLDSAVDQTFRRQRGLFSSFNTKIHYTAGYVVAWVEREDFQDQARAFFIEQVKAFKPDVILAHSLGSLIAYNAFSHPVADEIRDILQDAYFVTLGSQLGNPFVVGNLNYGRVDSLDVKHWYHLYNKHDDVFTAEIKILDADNFSQIDTPFDVDGIMDHAGHEYLRDAETRALVWAPIVADHADDARGMTVQALAAPAPREARSRVRDTRRKALLIGIDDYPTEADRLFGCVNDVYLMSATLQDCGFDAEDIRVCVNSRATARGILDRMEWLFDDPRASDQLVLYYSGHGAQYPAYNVEDEPDRLVETLVPYDFDWSPETSVSDDQIYRFYSQLPYDLQLLMVFDCCHSGGIHRQSGAGVRSISPPDDIRHRGMAWDRKHKMWVERGFKEINRRFASRKKDREPFFGENGATVRLGRASALRVADHKAYEKTKKAQRKNIVGPYLPLILEACDESQLAYEYRHGNTSYGIFTYCLTSILREEKNITFERLHELTAEKVKALGYRQIPQMLGPAAYKSAPVPFDTGLGEPE